MVFLVSLIFLSAMMDAGIWFSAKNCGQISRIKPEVYGTG
jgi:hypothetical protein